MFGQKKTALAVFFYVTEREGRCLNKTVVQYGNVNYNKAMYTAVIEIPKGDGRRRHLNYEKTAIIDLGPIRDVIPVNDGVMPVDYGYIEHTKNPIEGDEVDVIIFSIAIRKSGEKVGVSPIGLIRRDDGDDKVIAIDETISLITSWDDVSTEEKDLILAYFGYGHKILSIENREAAEAYLRKSLI